MLTHQTTEYNWRSEPTATARLQQHQVRHRWRVIGTKVLTSINGFLFIIHSHFVWFSCISKNSNISARNPEYVDIWWCSILISFYLPFLLLLRHLLRVTHVTPRVTAVTLHRGPVTAVVWVQISTVILSLLTLDRNHPEA